MIITNQQFPNYRKYEMMYEGRPLSMEVGKLAELCNAAVLVKGTAFVPHFVLSVVGKLLVGDDHMFLLIFFIISLSDTQYLEKEFQIRRAGACSRRKVKASAYLRRETASALRFSFKGNPFSKY